ncbi:hypothetical protein H1C71_029062 [Ictidomys tridecemlineatus]|nr:hypothetical protein H1C71_029062 [Ictidomys tridecemlineatus]
MSTKKGGPTECKLYLYKQCYHIRIFPWTPPWPREGGRLRKTSWSLGWSASNGRQFRILQKHAQGSTAGALTVGLVRQCQTIHGRDRTCIPPRLPPEWVTTLFFIIMGIISLTVTCGLLVASHWRREATKYARWIAFTGMILFCMAALIFPIGFYINEVGGQPYKLPNNTVVGSSYVLFVLSIFFTIVGLLFAGKVCLPG